MSDIEISRDQEVQTLNALATTAVEQAQAVVVHDEATLLNATGKLADVTRAQRSVEERREFFVKPLNEHVRSINGLFRGISAPLLEAQAILKDKILAYRLQEQRRAEEARHAAEEAERQSKAAERERLLALERARAEAEAAQRAAEEAKREELLHPNETKEQFERAQRMHIELVQQQRAAEEATRQRLVVREQVKAPPKTMTSARGAVTARRRWTYEIVDAKQIPREFLSVNEKAIGAAVKAGVREITGCRIFEDEILAVESTRDTSQVIRGR